MEFANDGSNQFLAGEVRLATAADAREIMRLLQSGDCVHGHVGWRAPGDWIGSPGFVVLPQERGEVSLRQALFGEREKLAACLAVGSDAPLAAWVQATAVANQNEASAAIRLMLAGVEDYLRATAVAELGWLVIETWANEILPRLGFTVVNEIQSYLKPDLTIPPQPTAADLVVRPAQVADMVALAEIEQVAFAPLWRYSADTLLLAHRQALSFDVAEWQGRLVGYQLSSPASRGAHLVRLTIDPALQGRGVGSALLAQAVASYQRYGAEQVTLNTQLDNAASQGLYRKFGFRPLAERFYVWAKKIEP